MNGQPYDAYFEKLYDQFIEKSETEHVEVTYAEQFETFLHSTARDFYEQGKRYGSAPENPCFTK